MTAREKEMPVFHTINAPKSFHNLNSEGLESLSIKKYRVKKELRAAGATSYGLLKFNARYLPNIIHDLEHIKAVIYGRYTEAPGLLSLTDRMIVATDRRIISLNHKPGYTDIDEFTYDIVDGVEELTAGPFSGVVLNTKINNLNIRFVNKNCADKFTHYIEKRRIEFYHGSTWKGKLKG